MSYDLGLYKNGKAVPVNPFSEGGTRPMHGTDCAELNITYNYGWFYSRYLDKKLGLRWLYTRKAKDCIKRLEKAVKILGTDTYRDYWADTPGNAGFALSILLEWAKDNPDAVFQGD